MGLRGMAGDLARNTSGMWRGIADALDPDGRGDNRRADSIDLTDPSAPSTDGPGPGPIAGPTAGPTGAAEDGFEAHGGRMVVPLDTWTRILEQVGNVHEAGQQLAEARERAARAETENGFLKEQLGDLKAQKRSPRRSSPKPAEPTVEAEAPSPSPPPDREGRLTRARRRAGSWISP